MPFDCHRCTKLTLERHLAHAFVFFGQYNFSALDHHLWLVITLYESTLILVASDVCARETRVLGHHSNLPCWQIA